MNRILLLLSLLTLPGCASFQAYNRNVAAREDSVSVQADERGNYGGTVTHRVEYRSFK